MGASKTDWRQFRKSTHLASADLDAMSLQNIPLIFTIKEVKYETNTNVSGTKMDGVFCYFLENIRPLKLNSTNSKILAGFAKKNGVITNECNVIENWKGLIIELYVDRNVKMMGTVTDGVRIKPLQPKSITQKPLFTTEMFESAKQASATIESISNNYQVTNEIAKQYEQYRTT